MTHPNITSAIADARTRIYTDTPIGTVPVPDEEQFSYAGGAGLVTEVVVYPFTYALIDGGREGSDHYGNLNALPPATLRRVEEVMRQETTARRNRSNRAVNESDGELPIGRTVDGSPVYAHIPPPTPHRPYLAIAFDTPDAVERFAVQVVKDIQEATDVVVDEAASRDANTARPQVRLTRDGRLTGWGELARDQIIETLRGVPNG